MGMGKNMGQIEIDERGRFTIPARIREKLKIKPSDKLIIINTSEGILLRKKPSKELIFKELVGCIKTPSKEPVTPESIKKIWNMKG